jgi:hypothetical protein
MLTDTFAFTKPTKFEFDIHNDRGKRKIEANAINMAISHFILWSVKAITSSLSVQEVNILVSRGLWYAYQSLGYMHLL